MTRHVFVSYVREDGNLVDKLVTDLRRHGVDVWLDRERIRPGERWRDAIRTAIRRGAMFVACFSRQYENRDRSYMNEELTLAMEELRMRPSQRAWFVPVLLSACQVPDRAIGAGETLRDIHWVDLSTDWDAGMASLVSVVHRTSATPRSGSGLLPTPLQRVLDAAIDGLTTMRGGEGEIIEVPEYLTAAVFESVDAEFPNRRDSVTYANIKFWGSANSLVDQFLKHSFAAVQRGCVVTRLIVISGNDLAQDWPRIAEELQVYFTGGVGVALTILEDITEAPSDAELDFTLYDGGKAIMFLRRENTSRIGILTSAHAFKPNGNVRIARQTKIYELLLEHCAIVSENFRRDYLGTVVLGTKCRLPMLTIREYDDIEDGVEQLYRLRKQHAG